MKKNLAVLAVVFSMIWGFAFAGGGPEMRITVPFDFYMENQLFPAGEYRFDMNSGHHATASLVTVWGAQSEDNRILATVPGTIKDQTVNQLTFNKYGQKHFLSEVSINGHKATVKARNLEKELRAQLAPAVITIAQK
jgi:hypothetical protein